MALFRLRAASALTVAVAALPKGARLEIEVIAAANDDGSGGKTVGDTSG